MESTSGEFLSPKSLLKILLFGCLLALILTIAGIILNPGKFFLEGHIKDRNARYAEIMTVPRDCIDIYNVGNSLAMVGISPMDLWNDEGFASFNLCKGASRTSEAYYLLRHGLKYQHPRVIMIETNMMFRSDEGSIREYYMGYLVSEHIMPYTGDLDYLKPTDEVKEIDPMSVFYMDRILRLCEKKNIDVILYSLCSPKCYDTTRLNAIRNYVSSRGVNYIDFNQNWKEMGIDWSHDTRDEGDHLNEYGVAKVTSYMGQYLREHYDLPDHRGEADYSSWDDLYTAYLQTLKDMEGVSYYMLEGDTVYD